MSQQLRIFIGYDPRQAIAYNVCAHSIASRASKPVSITRLQLNQLPITRRGLTEFTYSRYLPPFLTDYDGYSLFIDADMIVLDDIYGIMADVDPMAAVSVVKHNLAFERPSLMVFNGKRCRILTPAFIDSPANPMFDLAWASKVGGLPAAWNHLVGYQGASPAGAKVLHYTAGIPVWPETSGCDNAADWHREHQSMNSSVSFTELMGASVHVKRARLGDGSLVGATKA
jgi:hypothetical protein